MHARLVLIASLALAAWTSRGTFAADDALHRFYSWPPSPELPLAVGDEYWDWKPDIASDAPRLLDLRSLNEPIAGQDGWVHARGDRLFLGSGRPVRFWAVNTTGSPGLPELKRLAEGLARRGVNMIRIHGGASKSLLDFKAASLDAVNVQVIDQMHRAVAAARTAGIYVFASNEFFIIELKVRASHGLEGYTQEWLDAHPKQHTPFGLVFLNDRLRSAYKGWLRAFVTAPNPYDEQKRPLAQDRAVAVIEILNEENLFFWTFNPDNWPPEQRALAGAKFFTWLARRHRLPDDKDDIATVRRVLNGWAAPLPGDALEERRVALFPASRFKADGRSTDQLAFLHETQRDFHAEMTALLRELGYGGLVSPSNWATSNDAMLLDLEHDTYRVGGLIDRHAYYSPVAANEKAKWRIGAGDQFLAFSATATPAASSINVRQTSGYPSAMSEFAWVNYNPAGIEAPLFAAAYFSLTDFDLPVWFALPRSEWESTLPKWPVGTPGTLGQFPGAALLYRRGDVSEAAVVAREGRTLASQFRREPALIMPRRGFDSTRDERSPDGEKAAGRLDPLALLAGKVEVTYETDEDIVSPELARLIDRAHGRVTSTTGELVTDWRRGLMTINTPRSQGVTGFLRANGAVELRDVVVDSSNAFGAVLAISLDDQPLATSRKVLVQVGALDRLTGFKVKPVKMSHAGEEFAGQEIEQLGRMPWQVERIRATLTFKRLAARTRTVMALDPEGRPRGAVPFGASGNDLTVSLAPDSLYTIIELSPP